MTTATVLRGTSARRASTLGRRRRRVGLLMSAPAVVLVTLVLGIPIVQAVYYSMTTWDGVTATWVGPSAYVQLFKDPIFWRVMQNNALLLLAVPVAIGIPLGIAFLVNQKVTGWKFFRSVYFLPTAISWVVIGIVAQRFFAQAGTLNSILKTLGLGFIKTDMLSGEYTALLAVAITFIWSMVGTNTIIFLTGMAALDPTLNEAAAIDGATAWQIFRRVTMPQLRRFIQFSFVITLISAFTALFSLIFVMTGGGPGFGTTTLEFWVYDNAFQQGQFGTGALLGVVLFVIMAIVGFAQIKLLGGGDD